MQADPNIKTIKTIKTNSDIFCVKYTDEKKSIAAGFKNGSVSLYNNKTNDLEVTLADEDTKDINNVVTCISHRPDIVTNTLTCSYSGGLIKKWNYLTGACIFTIREPRQTCGVVYHPKLAKIFSYGDDGHILMYDEETRKRELSFQPSEKRVLDGHVTKVLSLCFNPASTNEFVSGGWDTTVQFWDTRKPTAVRWISDVFLGGEGLTINKAGTELITCEYKRENSLKLWDYGKGEMLHILKPDPIASQLYCGKHIKQNTIAIGGSDQNIIRIVDMTSYTTISYVKGLSGGVYSLDYCNPKKNQQLVKTDEMFELPNIAFCSGKNIHEIRYR